MTRVAVMQPYFMPYLGYFRLFAATDVFVIYDCVQFPARGWVHRNRLHDKLGRPQWLTLPVAKKPRSTLIREMSLRLEGAELHRQMRRFPALERPNPLLEEAKRLSESLTDYLERTLQTTCRALGLEWRTLRSSQLDISPELRGQDRILAIAETLGATTYVNAPGGRALYDGEDFRARGIELAFLPDYRGDTSSVLERFGTSDGRALARELSAQLS